MGFIEDQIAAHIRERDLVTKQIQACRNQTRSTLNDSDRERLKEQEKQLRNRYDRLNQEIERLRTGGAPELTPEALSRCKAEFRNEWEADLYQLDYDKPENALHKLVRVKHQTAVLLFIQRWIRMKAELYIKRIRKNIFDDGKLRPFIEDFSNEARVDPQRFVERWHTSLQIEESGAGVQNIIQKLRGAAHGQTLYLEIRVGRVSDDFLGWFLEKFWRPLIEAKGICAVVILMVEDRMPEEKMRRDWRCQIKRFERYKYCEIKLPNWQRQDIEHWMDRYLNAALRKRHLSPQDACTKAEQVYTRSGKGVPLNAYNYILGDLLTQVVDQLPGKHHATS